MVTIINRRVGRLPREKREKLLKDLDAAKREYERAKRITVWKKRIGQQVTSPLEGLQQDYRIRYAAIGIKYGVILPLLKFE